MSICTRNCCLLAGQPLHPFYLWGFLSDVQGKGGDTGQYSISVIIHLDYFIINLNYFYGLLYASFLDPIMLAEFNIVLLPSQEVRHSH